MEWLRPWVLLLLPLPLLAWRFLPALPARALLRVPSRIQTLLQAFAPSGVGHVGVGSLDLWLRALGWLAVVVALAGPQTPDHTLLRPSGRDLMVAIDLSASMGQRDMGEQDMVLGTQRASRLSVVTDLLDELIERRVGDRIGLIAFSNEAFLIAPLTFDLSAVSDLLDELSIGLPGNRTDLGGAIGLAIQTFKRYPPAERVLLLISDGEDNAGALTSSDAALLAAQHAIRIHTVGFSGVLKPDGVEVLKHMSAVTGGHQFAAQSANALAEVAAEIERLEPIEHDGEPAYLMRDWTWLALVLALLSLATISWRELRGW